MIEVKNIEDIIEYFSFDMDSRDTESSFGSLKKAVGRGDVLINDETNCLALNIKGDGVRLFGKSGKFTTLEFRRATGAERRLLMNKSGGKKNMGDAIFAVISKLCGIVSADLDASPAQEVAAMEDIVDLFLLSG